MVRAWSLTSSFHISCPLFQRKTSQRKPNMLLKTKHVRCSTSSQPAPGFPNNFQSAQLKPSSFCTIKLSCHSACLWVSCQTQSDGGWLPYYSKLWISNLCPYWGYHCLFTHRKERWETDPGWTLREAAMIWFRELLEIKVFPGSRILKTNSCIPKCLCSGSLSRKTLFHDIISFNNNKKKCPLFSCLQQQTSY